MLLQLKQRALHFLLCDLSDLEHPNYSTPAFQPQEAVLHALFEPRLWYQALLLAGKSESRVLRYCTFLTACLGKQGPRLLHGVVYNKDNVAIASVL